MKLFLEEDIFCNFLKPGTQVTILENKRTACPDGKNLFLACKIRGDAKPSIQEVHPAMHHAFNSTRFWRPGHGLYS